MRGRIATEGGDECDGVKGGLSVRAPASRTPAARGVSPPASPPRRAAHRRTRRNCVGASQARRYEERVASASLTESNGGDLDPSTAALLIEVRASKSVIIRTRVFADPFLGDTIRTREFAIALKPGIIVRCRILNS
jgi:hypothetical protein